MQSQETAGQHAPLPPIPNQEQPPEMQNEQNQKDGARAPDENQKDENQKDEQKKVSTGAQKQKQTKSTDGVQKPTKKMVSTEGAKGLTEHATVQVLTGKRINQFETLEKQFYQLEPEQPSMARIEQHIAKAQSMGISGDGMIFASSSYMDRFSTTLSRLRAYIGSDVTDEVLVSYVRRAIQVLNYITPPRKGAINNNFDTEFTTKEVLEKAIELYTFARSEQYTKLAVPEYHTIRNYVLAGSSFERPNEASSCSPATKSLGLYAVHQMINNIESDTTHIYITEVGNQLYLTRQFCLANHSIQSLSGYPLKEAGKKGEYSLMNNERAVNLTFKKRGARIMMFELHHNTSFLIRAIKPTIDFFIHILSSNANTRTFGVVPESALPVIQAMVFNTTDEMIKIVSNDVMKSKNNEKPNSALYGVMQRLNKQKLLLNTVLKFQRTLDINEIGAIQDLLRRANSEASSDIYTVGTFAVIKMIMDTIAEFQDTLKRAVLESAFTHLTIPPFEDSVAFHLTAMPKRSYLVFEITKKPELLSCLVQRGKASYTCWNMTSQNGDYAKTLFDGTNKDMSVDDLLDHINNLLSTAFDPITGETPDFVRCTGANKNNLWMLDQAFDPKTEWKILKVMSEQPLHDFSIHITSPYNTGEHTLDQHATTHVSRLFDRALTHHKPVVQQPLYDGVQDNSTSTWTASATAGVYTAAGAGAAGVLMHTLGATTLWAGLGILSVPLIGGGLLHRLWNRPNHSKHLANTLTGGAWGALFKRTTDVQGFFLRPSPQSSVHELQQISARNIEVADGLCESLKATLKHEGEEFLNQAFDSSITSLLDGYKIETNELAVDIETQLREKLGVTDTLKESGVHEILKQCSKDLDSLTVTRAGVITLIEFIKNGDWCTFLDTNVFKKEDATKLVSDIETSLNSLHETSMRKSMAYTNDALSQFITKARKYAPSEHTRTNLT